jgi:hypothetical protein
LTAVDTWCCIPEARTVHNHLCKSYNNLSAHRLYH